MSEWKAYPVESLGIVRMIAHPTTGSDSDLLDDEKSHSCFVSSACCCDIRIK